MESYISNYEGITRLDRLALIGTSSRYLGVDALRLGVREAIKGKSVAKYESLVFKLALVAPTDVLAKVDEEWVQTRRRAVNIEKDRLEAELKSYKNNLIKESIRVRDRGSVA